MDNAIPKLSFTEIYRDIVAYFIPGFLLIASLPALAPTLWERLFSLYGQFDEVYVLALVLAGAYLLGKVTRLLGRTVVLVTTRSISILFSNEKKATSQIDKVKRHFSLLFSVLSYEQFKTVNDKEIQINKFLSENTHARDVFYRHRSTYMMYESLLGVALVLGYLTNWHWWIVGLSVFFFVAARNSNLNTVKYGAKLRKHLGLMDD